MRPGGGSSAICTPGRSSDSCSAVIVLKLALRALKRGEANAGELLAEALGHAELADSELRELAHGILPSELTRGGLRAGLNALMSRVSLPVDLEVSVERLPLNVEATGHFVVSGALTNVVKHAEAGRATVTAEARHGLLGLEIRDDGVGGADSSRGSGLVGISDRVEASAARSSPQASSATGTTLTIEIPVEVESGVARRWP